ncbi:hypothetical protein C8J57DRAFT_1458506, partial [Mycena rebaudengoi]
MPNICGSLQGIAGWMRRLPENGYDDEEALRAQRQYKRQLSSPEGEDAVGRSVVPPAASRSHLARRAGGHATAGSKGSTTCHVMTFWRRVFQMRRPCSTHRDRADEDRAVLLARPTGSDPSAVGPSGGVGEDCAPLLHGKSESLRIIGGFCELLGPRVGRHTRRRTPSVLPVELKDRLSVDEGEDAVGHVPELDRSDLSNRELPPERARPTSACRPRRSKTPLRDEAYHFEARAGTRTERPQNERLVAFCHSGHIFVVRRGVFGATRQIRGPDDDDPDQESARVQIARFEACTRTWTRTRTKTNTRMIEAWTIVAICPTYAIPLFLTRALLMYFLETETGRLCSSWITSLSPAPSALPSAADRAPQTHFTPTLDPRHTFHVAPPRRRRDPRRGQAHGGSDVETISVGRARTARDFPPPSDARQQGRVYPCTVSEQIYVLMKKLVSRVARTMMGIGTSFRWYQSRIHSSSFACGCPQFLSLAKYCLAPTGRRARRQHIDCRPASHCGDEYPPSKVHGGAVATVLPIVDPMAAHKSVAFFYPVTRLRTHKANAFTALARLQRLVNLGVPSRRAAAVLQSLCFDGPTVRKNPVRLRWVSHVGQALH